MSDAKKNSVLIVDDEISNIMALTHILSPEYTVYAAKNGPDAIATAVEHAPDVILLDILMPEMDGYEVIAALKASDATQAIPVLFITGLDNLQDEEKGLARGAADYIVKPFRGAIVQLRVRNQIRILNYIRTIKDLSSIDQLTGIPNRRGLDERLPLEWGRAMRTATPLSIFVLDLDDFKIYNDTYGHMQGDVLLQAVAKMLPQELRRSGDFCARWGGEEFVALLPDTHEATALTMAEQLRKRIEDAVIPLADGRATKITVSIGLNSQVPAADKALPDFLHNADKALYIAKKEGKNRVCRYEGTDQT